MESGNEIGEEKGDPDSDDKENQHVLFTNERSSKIPRPSLGQINLNEQVFRVSLLVFIVSKWKNAT